MVDNIKPRRDLFEPGHVMTYPEMNAEIKSILSISGAAVQLYAAARIHELETQYNDLVMAVARKFDGETRHETARRYIVEAEQRMSEPCSACGDGDTGMNYHTHAVGK